MKAYLIAMLIVFGINVIGKLRWLATGERPLRQGGEIAFDVFMAALFIVWTAVLLVQI